MVNIIILDQIRQFSYFFLCCVFHNGEKKDKKQGLDKAVFTEKPFKIKEFEKILKKGLIL